MLKSPAAALKAAAPPTSVAAVPVAAVAAKTAPKISANSSPPSRRYRLYRDSATVLLGAILVVLLVTTVAPSFGQTRLATDNPQSAAPVAIVITEPPSGAPSLDAGVGPGRGTLGFAGDDRHQPVTHRDAQAHAQADAAPHPAPDPAPHDPTPGDARADAQADAEADPQAHAQAHADADPGPVRRAGRQLLVRVDELHVHGLEPEARHLVHWDVDGGPGDSSNSRTLHVRLRLSAAYDPGDFHFVVLTMQGPGGTTNKPRTVVAPC